MALDVRPPAWGQDALLVPPQLQVQGLGNPRRVWEAQGNTIVVAVVLTVIGVAMIVAAAVVIAIVIPPGLILLFIGGLLGFLGIYNVIDLRRAARAIAEYDGGLVALVGSTTTTWPWESIAAIWVDESLVSGKRGSYHVYRYRIARANGDTLWLLGERFLEAKAIMSTLKSHVGPRLLAPLQKAYDASETLTFGPVTVSRASIAIGSHRLAWSAVGNVAVKKGRLTITPRDGGSPIELRASKIPNLEQLGALIGVDPGTMELTYY